MSTLQSSIVLLSLIACFGSASVLDGSESCLSFSTPAFVNLNRVAQISFRKQEIPIPRHIAVALHLGQGGNNGGPTNYGGGGDGGGDADYRIGLHFTPFDKNAIESSSSKHIFITGATGRIGRFLVAHLLQKTTHRISCLVRDPAHLQLPRSLKSAARNRLSLIVGGLEDVDRYIDAARGADTAVLLAVDWATGGGASDAERAWRVNVGGVRSVLRCLPSDCRVIYFSSAGLVPADAARDGRPAPAPAPETGGGDDEAGGGGGDGGGGGGGEGTYLRTKRAALLAVLGDARLQARLTVVYPALVFGPAGAVTPRERWGQGVERALAGVLRGSGLARAAACASARDAALATSLLIDGPDFGRPRAGLRYEPRPADAAGGRVWAAREDSLKGQGGALEARHVLLGSAPSAAEVVRLRCAGSAWGALLGWAVGSAGAPLDDGALAAWSAATWSAVGAATGGVQLQAMPSALVAAAAALSGGGGRRADVLPPDFAVDAAAMLRLGADGAAWAEAAPAPA